MLCYFVGLDVSNISGTIYPAKRRNIPHGLESSEIPLLILVREINSEGLSLYVAVFL